MFKVVRRVAGAGVQGVRSRRGVYGAVAAGLIVLALSFGFVRSSLAQFIPLPAVTWTGSDAAPAFRTLKAPPVTPATALGVQGGSATSTNGLCRDHPSNIGVCVGGATPHSQEFLELSRSLRGDPDVIYEFVRNGIDTEFQFGLTKGDEGTIVDRSGTAFDQAKLLVDLLRHAGFTARYKFGDIALTPAQFEQWTGFTDARSACEFLASGGIPVSINGSSTACDQTGAVVSAVIAHVWVEADIQGQAVQLDPSFKSYNHYAGMDVRTMAGMTAGAPMSTATQGVSRSNGGATTQNYDDADLATYLTAREDALRMAIRLPANRGKSTSEIVGGRAIIDAERPIGGWRATSLAHASTVRATWTGGVPDAYRTTLNIQYKPYMAPQTTLTADMFADEVYGTPISLNATGIAYAGAAKNATPSQSCQRLQACAERVAVTINRPFAAQSSAYGDSSLSRPLKGWDGAVLVLGFGDSSPLKARRWSQLYQDTYLGAEYSGYGFFRRPSLAASWLAQFAQASDLQGELAESRVTHLHTLGVIYSIHTDGYDQRTDFTNIIDLETAVAVTSREGSATKRRALIHALAATAATLEGSVAEQSSNNPASASTARRMTWANTPVSQPQAKYYAIAAGGAAPAVGAFTLNGVTATTTIEAQPFRSALTAYLGKGFAITATSEMLLGPGREYGNHFENGEGYAAPSTERGGAFVATKYDGNGDPIEIAHVVTNHYVAAKGGGAPAAQEGAPNPSNLIRDDFEDRSGVAGVDLRTGMMSYSTPVLDSKGQGEFPYKLEERLELRGGGFGIYHLASRDISVAMSPRAATGLVSNFDGSVELTSSGMEAMGETRADAAAGTIVGFLALQDVYAAAVSADRDIVGTMVADWWGRGLVHNVATVTQGGAAKEYLFSGRESGRRVFRDPSGGAGRVYAEGELISEDQWWSTQYPWVSPVPELTDRQMVFETIDQDGTKRTYEAPTPAGGITMGHRLKTWRFPAGVVLTMSYAGGYIDNYIPASVSSNLGLSLTLNSHPMNANMDRNSHPAGIAYWNCNDYYAPGFFSVTDAGGRIHKVKVQGGYGDKCVIESVYSPRSAVTPVLTYTYDVFGRVKEIKDAVAIATPAARGAHQIFAIGDFRGQRQDPLGGRYTVETGNDGRTQRHIDEEGRVSTADFDGEGRVIRRVAAYGNITEFKYDDRNNLIELKRLPKAGCGVDTLYWCQTSTVTATYDTTWNKPLTVTLPATGLDGQAAHTWTFGYDSQGRLTSQTSPTVFDGKSGTNATAVWQTGYDAYGRVNWTRDPTGIESRMEYGTNGQSQWCMSKTVASSQLLTGLNQTSTFTCNAVGDVLTATDPRGNVTTFTYDAFHRKLTEIAPTATNIKTSWTYDADGNVLTQSRWDAAASLWRTTTNTWSPTGKLLTVTDPSSDVARTCYDALDRPTVTVDPTGRAISTEYNAASQPRFVKRWYTASTADATCALTQARPSHLTTNTWREIRYNAGGLQSAELDANGNATTMTYDGLGRLMLTTFADGKYVQTLRNERDQVYITFKRGGDIHQAYYDAIGRVTRVWEHAAASAGLPYPHGRHTGTSYDLAGRPVMTWVSTQTGTNGVYDASLERDIRTYVYDGAGRVIQDKIKPNDAGMGSNQLILTYGYDAANNRTSIEWPDGYRATYRFDAANRADRIQFGTAAAPTANQADIVHDSLSRRTSLTRSNGTVSAWTYEADDDLSGINHAWVSGSAQAPATYGFQRDAAGRITMTGVNRADLEWMPTVAEARTYGAPNNLNQLPSANGTALTWDANGNLDSYGTRDYVWTWGNRLAEVHTPTSDTFYGYDAQDRRTWMKEDNVVTRTLWSGDDEAGDYSDNGTVLRRYIPDGSGAMDARLAVVDAANAVVWFHTDNLGSVIATTSGAGQPIQFANYSPHGRFGTDQNGFNYTSTVSGSPFGYTGRRWDAKAQLYQYRARYYSPELGIFLSHDPIGTKDDPNLNMYVGLDPVNKTDPTGMQTATCTNCYAEIVVGDARTGQEWFRVPIPRDVMLDYIAGRISQTVSDVEGAIRGGTRNESRGPQSRPVPGAVGPHSVPRPAPGQGPTRGYTEYEPNPQNPTGHDEKKRVDVEGRGHTNPDGTVVPTPHVHQPGRPVRPAEPEELPRPRRRDD